MDFVGVMRALTQGWVERRQPERNARPLLGVPGRVHYRDAMLYDESPESLGAYLRAGRSAVAAIEQGLDACDRRFAGVRRALDFGCGHGRVLRHLREKIPARRISACEVDAEAVRFCAAEFGVRKIVSSTTVSDLRLGSYDLIWVGSVFTHLDQSGVDALFRKLEGALSPCGVLIFSCHGEFSAANLSHLYGGHYREQADDIYDEYRVQGFSFRPYDASMVGTPGGVYGMTWISRSYVEQRVAQLFGGRIAIRHFAPQGWDGHHDVFTLQRT
jgi:SAM-dependent methyltransferase